MQSSREILRRAVNTADVLKQADRLGDGLRQRVGDLLADIVDLAAHLAGDIPRHQVVHLVDPSQGTERLRREIDVRVNEKLLGELDDGAIGAANVLARSALRPQPRDRLDDEVDLVGHQRIEIDEALRRQLGQLDVGREPRVVGEAAEVLGEELAQVLLGLGVLRQHALARDLGDVRRLQVDLQREAIHEARQLDPLVVEPTDELGELFL